MENTRTLQVRLDSHPFFKGLLDQGMVYQDYPPDTVITVRAKKGDFNDWAAYFEIPNMPGPVLQYGTKLPEKVAVELFADFAPDLKYRR